MYFNSRPHEEVDWCGYCTAADFLLISTHDLTKRSTEGGTGAEAGKKYFNSRPHEEVDGGVVGI